MRHLVMMLVVIPLFQGFLFPFIRVLEEHITKINTTRLFRFGKLMLLIFLSVETAINWYLILNYSHPIVYSVGNWPVPIGIDIFLDPPALALLGIINVGMVVITIYSLSYTIHNEIKYYIFLSIIRAALVGLVISADIFNMYIFIELTSITSTGLIILHLTPRGLWGGFQYLVIGSVGGLLIFLGIALLYGEFGFLGLAVLASALREGFAGSFALNPQVVWGLGLIFLGGIIKIPLFPFSLWLPPAHGEAPLPVSALLSGVLLKVNFYFILRLLCYVFPYQPLFFHILTYLSVFSIIFGHIGALRARNAKQILAFSSIVNMGYAGLALSLSSPFSLHVTVLLLVQHFLGKTFAFLGIGVFSIEEKNKPRSLKILLKKGVFITIILSLLGLPPLPGFWAKWLLIVDSFNTGAFWPGLVVILSLFPGLVYYRRLYHLVVEERVDNKTRTGLSMELSFYMLIPLVIVTSFLFYSSVVNL